MLERADVIACEDTRVTAKLLRHIGTRTPMIAYHEHNEKTKAVALRDLLTAGKSVALVSDAGTPGISDPGFRIVRECRRHDIPVEAIPGPCALTALLSVSGLPTNGFLFVGFLPPKGSARRGFFDRHRDFAYTLALYESCHRIGKCLADIVSSLGPERVVAIGKELTKIHETVLVGPARNVIEKMASVTAKGEYTILIAPPSFEL